MNNYYKYLPVSAADESWGLCVLNAGCNRIPTKERYPPQQHPAHHYFDFNRGRTLHDEYQLIYITQGEGIFETQSMGEVPVSGGSILMLFPDEWHRFRPDEEKGWDEYWIGFHGTMMNNLVSADFFRHNNALLKTGIREELLLHFINIIDETRKEKAGYQPLISGMVMHLLGHIHAITRQREFAGTDLIETIVNKACLLLRENTAHNISIQEIATQLNVGYSWFRKVFKTYTGIAPGQYLIQLKIEKAKRLLGDPSKTIREIAGELHFDSYFYFSRLFKEKTGLSPEQYKSTLL